MVESSESADIKPQRGLMFSLRFFSIAQKEYQKHTYGLNPAFQKEVSYEKGAHYPSSIASD